MRRKGVAEILLILIISIGYVGTLVTVSEFQKIDFETPVEPPEADFQWGIDVGATFLYRLRVSVEDSGWSGVEYTFPFDEINGTKVIVTIVSLPDVSELSSADEIDDILNHLKIECQFLNQTQISPQLISPYTPLMWIQWMCVHISRAFLPIGGWELLDWFWRDAPITDDEREGSGYFSKRYSSFLRFGYNVMGIDYETGWQTHCSLTNGMPLVVEYWTLDYDTELNYLRAEMRLIQ